MRVIIKDSDGLVRRLVRGRSVVLFFDKRTDKTIILNWMLVDNADKYAIINIKQKKFVYPIKPDELMRNKSSVREYLDFVKDSLLRSWR